MITHIQGKLIEKTPTYVVVDVHGIGYKIKISLQTFSAIDGESCKLFTHLSVKEDSHTLFGFHEESERHLFRNLISVSSHLCMHNQTRRSELVEKILKML